MKKLFLLSFLFSLVFVSCNKDDDDNSVEYSSDGTYANLGLPSGTLWATCNVGAEKPEEVGGYFAWGETTAKTKFNDYNYKFYDKNSSDYTKYNDTDNLTTLDSEDDAATVNLGKEWRMPTFKECEELVDECEWIEISDYKSTGVSGVAVFKRKSSSDYDVEKDVHIFLPFGGYYTTFGKTFKSTCNFWPATKGYGFGTSIIGYPYADEGYDREAGLNIRPVRAK